MEMRVLALALLGSVAHAQTISCSQELPCPDDLVCVPDRVTDRSGRTGLCSRRQQWPGDECSALVGSEDDNCDRTQNLICVTNDLYDTAAGYQCQYLKTMDDDGCLSTAISFASQCIDMVCAAFPDSLSEGTCTNVQEERGGACVETVRSGPGYTGNTCAEGMVCPYDQCVLVSTDGTCETDGEAADMIICPAGEVCSNGVCVEGALQICFEDFQCQSDEVCAGNICRPTAEEGGQCDEALLGPGAFCPRGQVCLDDDAGGHLCYPDLCYGNCGDFTECDGYGACVPVEVCEVDAQDKCCVPTKEPSPMCDTDVRACVCQFDPACCETGPDSSGWDWYCINGAEDYCALTCEDSPVNVE